ncbi:MAG TPA: site-2 protease family protein [Dehalococcoidia bacterium]|nr:site-2 protease family protein [Dehalococcoidia bacterium]
MLFQLLDELMTNPARFPVVLLTFLATIGLGLVVALTVHEFSHAAVATGLGDDTPRRQGRLSLNPLRHLDPMGTLLLMVAGFGWGRPVRVDPRYFQRWLSPRAGMALVAAAGPLSNLLTATLLALPIRLGLLHWHSPLRYSTAFLQRDPALIVADILGWLILYNVFLGVFNLIPLAPLDGFNLALGVVPANLAGSLARLQPMGMGLLMAAVMLDYFFRFGILARFLLPVANTATMLLVGKPL